jgi:hypothetical protein
MFDSVRSAPTETMVLRPLADSTAPMPACAAPEPEPRWVHDLWGLPLVRRLRAGAAALWLFYRSPYAFGQAWVRGDARLPNPGVALATAVSVLALLAEEARRLLHKEKPGGLLTSAAETLGPYVLYLAWGLIAHVCLRTFGSRRRLGTSLGISLLAGAGPGTVAGVVVTLVIAALGLRYGVETDFSERVPSRVMGAAIAVVYVAYLYAFVAFQLALAGAHRLARWKGIVAGTIAVLAIGFSCGALEGATGEHGMTKKLGPHLSLTRHGKSFNASINW